MVKPPPRRVSWYGKLPARGDFVGRGLPPRWRSDWDGWLQRGLALAATTLDGAALRERLRRLRAVALPGAAGARRDLVRHHGGFARSCRTRFSVDAGRTPCRAGVTATKALHGSRRCLARQQKDPKRSRRRSPPCRHAPSRNSKPAEAWPPQPASLWWPLAAAHDVRSPDGGLATGAGAAARTARYSTGRAPDRERGIVVLVAAVGSLHSRFEAIEPGLNAAAADHAARHREHRRRPTRGRRCTAAAHRRRRASAGFPGSRSRSLRASRAPKSAAPRRRRSALRPASRKRCSRL